MKNGVPTIEVMIPTGISDVVMLRAMISTNTMNDAPITAEIGISFLLLLPTMTVKFILLMVKQEPRRQLI